MEKNPDSDKVNKAVKKGTRGMAMVEFAVVIPVLCILATFGVDATQYAIRVQEMKSAAYEGLKASSNLYLVEGEEQYVRCGKLNDREVDSVCKRIKEKAKLMFPTHLQSDLDVEFLVNDEETEANINYDLVDASSLLDVNKIALCVKYKYKHALWPEGFEFKTLMETAYRTRIDVSAKCSEVDSYKTKDGKETKLCSN